MRRAGLALVAVAGLVGCGGNPVDEFADKQEDAVTAACDCEAVRSIRGAITPEECVATFDLPNETDRDCGKAWYDRHQEVAEGPTNCAIDVVGDFKNCIDAAACNGAAIVTCATDSETAYGLCPDLPTDVLTELAACDIYAQ